MPIVLYRDKPHATGRQNRPISLKKNLTAEIGQSTPSLEWENALSSHHQTILVCNPPPHTKADGQISPSSWSISSKVTGNLSPGISEAQCFWPKKLPQASNDTDALTWSASPSPC